MGIVKVSVDPDALQEIADRVAWEVDEDRIVAIVQSDARHALTMATKAHERLTATFAPRKDRRKKECWRSDPLICAYFGEDALTIRQMRRTRERMQRARTRFSDRTLRISVKPQSTQTDDAGTVYEAIGHNGGGPITPLRFKIYPRYFEDEVQQRAASLIHETLHDWHVDHMVRDPDGGDERRPAYFGRLTRQIARDKPRQARRNPDNHARFALAVSGHPVDP